MASGGSPNPKTQEETFDIDDKVDNDETAEDKTTHSSQWTTVVLFGKTGSGKSSLANSLLGKCRFETKLCPQSVTNITSFLSPNNEQINIIDTPGFFNTNLTEENVKDEIKKSIYLTKPGPHVFLYTIKIGRYSEEERKSIKVMEDIFGSDIFRYIIVVFTAEDYLINENLDQYVKTLPQIMQQFINNCNKRVIAINNFTNDSEHDCSRLIREIKSLKQSNKSEFYQDNRQPGVGRKILNAARDLFLKPFNKKSSSHCSEES